MPRERPIINWDEVPVIIDVPYVARLLAMNPDYVTRLAKITKSLLLRLKNSGALRKTKLNSIWRNTEMDIIANNREYTAFKDLEIGEIFVLIADGEWYIKHHDDCAVRLTDGETLKPKSALLLCESKNCVLMEREIYTALTEKECYNECGI